MVTPPMTEQRVSECRYSQSGRARVPVLQEAGIVTWSGTAVPSLHGQPKFVSRASRGKRSKLLTHSLPTSPMSIAFVVGSMENPPGIPRPVRGRSRASAPSRSIRMGFQGCPAAGARETGSVFSGHSEVPSLRRAVLDPEHDLARRHCRARERYAPHPRAGRKRSERALRVRRRFTRSRPGAAARGQRLRRGLRYASDRHEPCEHSATQDYGRVGGR